jgi:hypothetical protein
MNSQTISPPSPMLGGTGTSAGGPMLARARELVLCIAGTFSISGTNATEARPEYKELSPSIEQTSSGAAVKGHPSTGAGVLELRRLSGLTWDQLASLFGVARRSVHFWASGKSLNAINEDRLNRILSVVRRIDRGSATDNRTAIMSAQKDGTIPLDLLKSDRFDEVVDRLGEGGQRPRVVLTPLSAQARESRLPPNPETLTGALQDSVHRKEGKSRPARSARARPKR